jgi:hypothetical protein
VIETPEELEVAGETNLPPSVSGWIQEKRAFKKKPAVIKKNERLSPSVKKPEKQQSTQRKSQIRSSRNNMLPSLYLDSRTSRL